MFGEFGVVGVEVVRWGLGFEVVLLLLVLGLGAVEGGERRFDADLALAAAAFCGGFFWGGEGEEAEGDGGGLLVWGGYGS